MAISALYMDTEEIYRLNKFAKSLWELIFVQIVENETKITESDLINIKS